MRSISYAWQRISICLRWVLNADTDFERAVLRFWHEEELIEPANDRNATVEAKSKAGRCPVNLVSAWPMI